tara:strand:+ start:698 stop:1216 length:519 start_codon:yes stop_codon:yes gene_type:complete
MKRHKKNKLWSIFILMMLLNTGTSFAKKNEVRAPLGCKDVGYEFEFNILTLYPKEAGTRNSLYFIRNNSNKKINLYQMRSDGSAHSMYLNHDISKGRWAVLSTCEKEIRYVCTVDDKKSKYGQIVDCGKNLQVCEFARVRFGLNNRGNHWIVDNNTRNGAVREVVNYGIIPQ